MDFWTHKINVSEESARIQVDILRSFSPDRRLQIALDIANMGVDQTRRWIKENNPSMSDLEITLEFVRLIYFQTGRMSEETWKLYKRIMTKKITKDWSARFRRMLKERDMTYDDVAKIASFKSGKVIEATISRGLPSFAKLAVVLHEKKS